MSKQKKTKKPPENAVANFFYTLFTKQKVAAFGLVVIVFLVLVAIFADVLAPYKMTNGALTGNIMEKLQGPSLAHPFGTDTIGRDMLSYIIYGTRTSVIIAICCTTITIVEAVVIGVASAVIGGWFDLIVQRIVDAWMCIPAMLMTMVLMVALGNGMLQMIIVLSVPAGVTLSRLFRSTAMTVKDSGYMEMSAMLGAGKVWRMVKHVLPNIMPLVLMTFAGTMGSVVMMEASLSFLGFGVDPSTPDWGAMLTGSGRSNMYRAPWLAIIPGIAIALLVFAAAMLGDGVRDILDPRLKGGATNYRSKKKKKKTKKEDAARKETE